MGFAWVQSVPRVQSGPNVVAPITTPTIAGNLLVVFVRFPNTESITSVTDDVGNTYVIGTPFNGVGTLNIAICYAVQVVGGATSITVTFSGATTNKAVMADEFSGNASTNATAYDTTATGSGTGTSCATAALTPAAPGELIVGLVLRAAATATFAAGSGYTLGAGPGGGSTSQNICAQYRLSGTISETAPMTLGTSVAWGDLAMAFRPAPTSGFFRFM